VDSAAARIAPHATETAEFRLPAVPWTLGTDFVPLGFLVARANDRSWTREVELGVAGTAPVP
jgi:hypothetical protein